MIAACAECAHRYADEIAEEIDECQRDFGTRPEVGFVTVPDCDYHETDPRWSH